MACYSNVLPDFVLVLLHQLLQLVVLQGLVDLAHFQKNADQPLQHMNHVVHGNSVRQCSLVVQLSLYLLLPSKNTSVIICSNLLEMFIKLINRLS